MAKPDLLPAQDGAARTPTPHAQRDVWFEQEEQAISTPVFQRDELTRGARIDGPAIVEQVDSTTVVPPGARAEIDEWLNIRIHVSE